MWFLIRDHNMNSNFVKWAEEAYNQNPDIIKHWKQSNDILERALANAVFEAVGEVGYEH
jgi:hypothetical protein